MSEPATLEEFEQLYRDTVGDVLAYLRRRSPADADDLAAEVYVVAWRRRADLPDPTSMRRAWLFGVARVLLSAAGRHQARGVRLVEDLTSGVATRDQEWPSFDNGTSAVIAAA